MKSTVFRLGVYRIRQAIATQGKRFLLFFVKKNSQVYDTWNLLLARSKWRAMLTNSCVSCSVLR